MSRTTLLHRLFGLGRLPRRAAPALEVSATDDRLEVRFDASRFHDDHSGTVECRFRTDHARSFAEHLDAAQRAIRGTASPNSWSVLTPFV